MGGLKIEPNNKNLKKNFKFIFDKNQNWWLKIKSRNNLFKKKNFILFLRKRNTSGVRSNLII